MINLKNIPLLLVLSSAIVFTSKAQSPTKQQLDLSDAPTTAPKSAQVVENKITYQQALGQWNISDINTWIKENFNYNLDRAKQLADNSTERGKTPIYTPQETYQIKSGVCIDLTRFAVETIQQIDSLKVPKYLMLDFEPVTIDGKVLRKHWLALYKENNHYFVFADTKRPGHVAGPYPSVDNFVKEYEAFRNRKILSYKVLDSYKKKQLKQQQLVERQ